MLEVVDVPVNIVAEEGAAGPHNGVNPAVGTITKKNGFGIVCIGTRGGVRVQHHLKEHPAWVPVGGGISLGLNITGPDVCGLGPEAQERSQ